MLLSYSREYSELHEETVSLPLSSMRLWLRSIVRNAGLLLVITDTASLWRKSDLWVLTTVFR